MASKLDGFDFDSVGVGRTADGGHCLAIRGQDGGWTPFTEADSPVDRAKSVLKENQESLSNGLQPACVVGLNPGILLDMVFDHFKEFAAQNNPFRRIYVIVDSRRALAGWLKASDRMDILSRLEVEFFLAEEVERIVEIVEADELRSHQFVALSTLPPARVQKALRPLAALFSRRQSECDAFLRANEIYYDAISDIELAGILSGQAGRKPRILVPTHLFSNVVRYSSRDACESFQNAGWESRLLTIESELTSWRFAKSIYDFKPDMLLWINHLRTEDGKFNLIPKNLFMSTWVQDPQGPISSHAMAERWAAFALSKKDVGCLRRRDIMVGYVEGLLQFGYPAERLIPLVTPANPRIFNTESGCSTSRFVCDVCFASNRSEITGEVVERRLTHVLAPHGVSKSMLESAHDLLWTDYRAGKAYTSIHTLLSAMSGISGLAHALDALDADSRTLVSNELFWWLNDLVYRQVVLEWCAETGADLRIYGKGWSNHPRLGRFAKGHLEHGHELSEAYRAAKFCLHLNCLEGYHQRIAEITMSGANILTRQTAALSPKTWRSAMSKAALGHFDILTPEESEAFSDWTFNTATGLLSQGVASDALEAKVLEAVSNTEKTPEVLIQDFEDHIFKDKLELAQKLRPS